MTYSPYTKIKDLIKPDILPFAIAIFSYGIFTAGRNLKNIFLSTEMYLIFVSTVILTQFISNAASVALILPVAIEFSNVLGISPSALIMLVLFGASLSFLTPMGYQTNLMVYGPGRYRFFDIAKYGAGLTLIMSLIVPALIILNFR